MSSKLDLKQQQFLLKLARKAIEYKLESGKTLKVKVDDKTLKKERGAFVTLKVNGELRGCIGYPFPYKSLYQTIIEVAVSSATQDFRFPSLTLDELKETKIEISVLTRPEVIKDPKEIEVGKHGIVISKSGQKGLLLPQVPTEHDWDLETYLRHGCLKAGLAEDEWKKGAQIEVFSAQVFSE
jgi:AmmeMemoRadiSam system protein A